MNIKLFTYVKKENSTARPSGSGRDFNCVMKADTSIINPVIVIDFADQDDPHKHLYNYAYIQEFNRYYFINDIIVKRGLVWEYSLSVDILGTYKDTISGSYLYLLRCAGDYDGDVIDSFYPIKANYQEAVRHLLTPWAPTWEEDLQIDLGTFILGITSRPGSDTDSAFGSIKYIAMTKSDLCVLINYLMDAGNLTQWGITLDGVTAEAAKSIIDPLTFIKSCQWTPIAYSSIETSEKTQGLNIWSWTVPGVRYKIMPSSPPYLRWTIEFTDIPRHPQARSRGNYLNTEPYTKMNMVIPPFGMIELDTTLTAKGYTISNQITYDMVTGMAILESHINNIDGPPLCRLQSQVGVPIQLTQVYNDYISAAGGVVGSTLGTIGSILTGNIAGAITGGIGAISSAANAMKPVVSSVGGTGCFADLAGWARLHAVFYDIPDEDRSHNGRPLCKEVYMSQAGIHGYCIAMHGDIPINGTAGEQLRLKGYLESGFFYE